VANVCKIGVGLPEVVLRFREMCMEGNRILNTATASR